MPPQQFRLWANREPDRGTVESIAYLRSVPRDGVNWKEITDPQQLRHELVSKRGTSLQLQIGNRIPQPGYELGDLLSFEPQGTGDRVALDLLQIYLVNNYELTVSIHNMAIRTFEDFPNHET
jgi:hypothetical protein